jgi:hypothetical protein
MKQCLLSCHPTPVPNAPYSHYTIVYQNFNATDENQSLTHLWYGVLEHWKGLACWRGWCSFSPQTVKLVSRISDTPASTKKHKYNIIYRTQYRMLQFLLFKESGYCTHTSQWLLSKIHCVFLRCHGGTTQDFVFWDTMCCWVSSPFPWCFEGTCHEQWTHEYEGDTFLQNNGNSLPSNTASHPSRSESKIHSITHKHWSWGDKTDIL